MTEQTQDNALTNGLPEGLLHPTAAKTLSFEEKVQWLKTALTDETIDNLDVATNIINFIRGGKKFTQDFFEHPIVIVSSAQEFIDLKRACKQELLDFTAKLLGIYLSCIKNCGNIVEADGPVPVPHCYLNVLLGLDFISLSKMQQDLSLKKVPYGDDGKIYHESLGILAVHAKALNILEEIIDLDAVKEAEANRDSGVLKEVKEQNGHS